MKINKILKILFIIIIILFFILGCLTIYKFSVINKIFKNMEKYVAKENYHMEIIDKETKEILMDVYYKDGVGKMITSDGKSTWTDGKEAYLIDNKSNEIQNLDFNSPMLISNEYVGSFVPGYSKDLFGKILLAGNLNTFIKIEKYENIKCYVIHTYENNIEKTIFFAYNNLLPIQANIKIGNIERKYLYNITFDETTSEDIRKPEVNIK